MTKIGELNNEYWKKIELKKTFSSRYSLYYSWIHEDFPGMGYDKKSLRMGTCLNYWNWDKYEKNKILDLKKVNRCKDRFCPNCKAVSLSLSINEFVPRFHHQIHKGYNPYLMTLTTPNVSEENLKNEIVKLQQGFTRLWTWINKENKGYKNRLVKFQSAIRMLEITYNSKTQMYNPHLHILLFSDGQENELDFKKYIPGPFRNKTQTYVSNVDIQIMQLWFLAYNKFSITCMDDLPKSFYDHDGNHSGLYNCHVVEIDSEKGIYEVFKYTFKDTDIVNFHIFKNITDALYKKRIRQGYGELYNLKLEHDEDMKNRDDSIEDYLEIQESPETLITQAIQDLLIVYNDYKKISRFNSQKYIDMIE